MPDQNLLKINPKDYYRHPPPHPGGKATHGVWDSIITATSLHSGLPLIPREGQPKLSPAFYSRITSAAILSTQMHLQGLVLNGGMCRAWRTCGEA